MMATYSLALMRRLTPRKALDLLFRTHVVSAPQILDNDHVAVRSRGLLHFNLGDDAVQSHMNLILCLRLLSALCGKILAPYRLDRLQSVKR